MATNMMQKGQIEYLMRGGGFEMALHQLREKGVIPQAGNYVHQEYPKALNLSLGVREFPMQTETASKQLLHWTEEREVIAPMVVQSEAEEDAVREAFERATDLGITIHAEWTPEVLLHAVRVAGQPRKNPNAPRPTQAQVVADRIAALKAELAALEPEGGAESEQIALPTAAAPPTTPRRRSGPAVELPVVAPDPIAA